MKIQTNAGEIELTAEMVRPGMVLRDYRGRVETILAHYDGGLWSVKGWPENDYTPPLADCWVALLGCDPVIAAREDVERFGVAPGIDAGAHGFARLRGGGAVDVRREAMAGVVASSIEFGERYDEYGFVSYGCTLAIGHDGDHEHLATGVRWAAKKETPPCCACGGATKAGLQALRIIARNEYGEDEKGALCEGCSKRVKTWHEDGLEARFEKGRLVAALAEKTVASWERGTFFAGVPFPPPRSAKAELLTELGKRIGATHSRIRFTTDDADGALTDVATLNHDGSFSCACGSTGPAEHREGCRLPWQYRMAATWAVDFTNARGEGLQRAVAEGLFGACAVALLTWCCRIWGQSAAGQLAARDAAVAKAIADVPEGCSATGWANVVRVIAADAVERFPRLGGADQGATIAMHAAMWAPFVAAYARERAAGYGCEVAAERVRDGSVCVLRLLAAYEGGR